MLQLLIQRILTLKRHQIFMNVSIHKILQNYKYNINILNKIWIEYFE